MKTRNLLLFSLVTIFISLISCNFNTTRTKSVDTEVSDSSLIISKKALEFVEAENLDSLKTLLSPTLKNTVSDNQWGKIIKQGKELIDNSHFPEDTDLSVSYTENKPIFGEEQALITYIFPFERKVIEDKKESIHISLNKNNQITQFHINYTKMIKFQNSTL